MRLAKLRVRNIASLKGEHEIDFLDIQKESPLFAITGETGSGKSTILNSIGLALYGQVYKKNVNQLDVVTLGEKEGTIELIFQVKGKYYLADWRAKVRKQNGELYSTPQTPSRNLYTIEAPEFSAAKHIAAVTAPELLNLDFDQFCKCIILNQGEFARFLTSSFTDRKDILEKLYPGELLESMGRELKLELDTLQGEKHEIEIKLGELRGDNLSGDVLKEQKSSLEADLKKLESASKNLEELDYHFVSLHAYFEKYLDNERKKETIKKDLTSETTKFNHILKNGEAIAEKYQKALKVQENELPILQGFLQKEETLKNHQDSYTGIQKRSADLIKNLTDLEIRIQTKDSEFRDAGMKLQNAEGVLHFPLKDLKKEKAHFNPLFDLFGENEIKSEEIKGKKERLGSLELTGKELKILIETKEASLKLIPGDIS
jgi:DNA repair protein SbcC/Rad50